MVCPQAIGKARSVYAASRNCPSTKYSRGTSSMARSTTASPIPRCRKVSMNCMRPTLSSPAGCFGTAHSFATALAKQPRQVAHVGLVRHVEAKRCHRDAVGGECGHVGAIGGRLAARAHIGDPVI